MAGLRRVAVPAQLAASALVVIATFLPWAHSGRRAIDVYEGGALAARLDLVSAAWAVRPLAVVPLALAGAALLRWWGRPGPAAAIAAMVAAYILVVGLVAMSTVAPPARGSGPAVALVGSVTLVAGVGLEVVSRRQAAHAGGSVHRRA